MAASMPVSAYQKSRKYLNWKVTKPSYSLYAVAMYKKTLSG